MKKVTISTRPTSGSGHTSADAWVNDTISPAEPMKRFTVDVPLSLHQRVKSQCALRNLKMADVVRELLEKNFPEEYLKSGGGEAPQPIPSPEIR